MIRERVRSAIRFMWIPGIRPVRVPDNVPRSSGIMNCSIRLIWKFYS